MDNFGRNLKTLRKMAGMNQDELAKRLGVRKTTISNYETSFSSPPKATLIEIAELFKVSIDELLGAPLRSTRPIAEGKMVMNSSNEPFGAAAREICVFSSVSELQDLRRVRGIADRISFMREPAQGELFGLVIDNDILSASGINAGDYVIARVQSEAVDGDVAVVSVNGAPAVVGVYYGGDEQITLMPDSNNKLYRPVFYSKADNEIKILGKVIRAIVNIS